MSRCSKGNGSYEQWTGMDWRRRRVGASGVEATLIGGGTSVATGFADGGGEGRSDDSGGTEARYLTAAATAKAAANALPDDDSSSTSYSSLSPVPSTALPIPAVVWIRLPILSAKIVFLFRNEGVNETMERELTKPTKGRITIETSRTRKRVWKVWKYSLKSPFYSPRFFTLSAVNRNEVKFHGQQFKKLLFPLLLF